MSAGTSSQLLKRPAVGGEYRTRSSRFRPLRSGPHVGIGLRSKISSEFSLFSAIQSGSPLIFESSVTTSREMPWRARSWPCSSSTIGLGLSIFVRSIVAMRLLAGGSLGNPVLWSRNCIEPDGPRPAQRDVRGRSSPIAQQLVQRAAAEHRGGMFDDDVRPRPRVVVAPLEQQPLGFEPCRRSRSLQREAAVELLAV